MSQSFVHYVLRQGKVSVERDGGQVRVSVDSPPANHIVIEVQQAELLVRPDETAQPPDPTHGRIDRDIQAAVDSWGPSSLGQRVAIENTTQTLRDRGEITADRCLNCNRPLVRRNGKLVHRDGDPNRCSPPSPARLIPCGCGPTHVDGCEAVPPAGTEAAHA